VVTKAGEGEICFSEQRELCANSVVKASLAKKVIEAKFFEFFWGWATCG
jgi:hypothetical protein